MMEAWFDAALVITVVASLIGVVAWVYRAHTRAVRALRSEGGDRLRSEIDASQYRKTLSEIKRSGVPARSLRQRDSSTSRFDSTASGYSPDYIDNSTRVSSVAAVSSLFDGGHSGGGGASSSWDAGACDSGGGTDSGGGDSGGGCDGGGD